MIKFLSKFLRWSLLSGLLLFFVVGLFLWPHVKALNVEVQQRFEGKRWSLPSRVYARPLELYQGRQLTRVQLVGELQGLGYQPAGRNGPTGSYSEQGSRVWVTARGFDFADGTEPGQRFQIALQDGAVNGLWDDANRPLGLVRLEPQVIASIYPQHNEDRILMKLEQWPPLLSAALQAVEDRRFPEHHGVDWQGIARAAWVNLQQGRFAQGGSTLTQQLVKNFFLTSERTLTRKFNEAWMALLLEHHYSKQEILEAYGNEIYLGQDGQRAIHGFGLASRFYFDQPLEQLDTHQIALLVGLLRGASYYDPRRFPERALQRRDQVLEILRARLIISEGEYHHAIAQPLGVVARNVSRITAYPAFLDGVRRQLFEDYRPEDLQSEGLRIFTTLDPWLQQQAETALQRQLSRQQPEIEGALVVTRLGSAEVVAMVGGKDPRFAGFNRAMDASRPIGSLIKPVVYLSALQQSRQYNLLSRIEDAPLDLLLDNGARWQPQNYDHQFYGEILLYQGLVASLNLATVHLGLEVGVEQVVTNLQRLGLDRTLPAYPSLLLGAVSLSPMEVTQLYQTIADEGFYTPLRLIREVADSQGQLLQRYPIETEQRLDEQPLFLLNRALELVVAQGTARGVKRYLPEGVSVAGKTGTTDELRDSWFAGFTGDLLAVAWLGRDDNQPANLTGASGAMQVWGDMMSRLQVKPLNMAAPPGVSWAAIDPESGLLAGGQCKDAIELPFIEGTQPVEYAPCAGGLMGRQLNQTYQWIKKAFE